MKNRNSHAKLHQSLGHVHRSHRSSSFYGGKIPYSRSAVTTDEKSFKGKKKELSVSNKYLPFFLGESSQPPAFACKDETARTEKVWSTKHHLASCVYKEHVFLFNAGESALSHQCSLLVLPHDGWHCSIRLSVIQSQANRRLLFFDHHSSTVAWNQTTLINICTIHVKTKQKESFI